MRKAKPLRIYREEFHAPPPPAGNGGSTRQTFDQARYENWRAYDERSSNGGVRKFFVGTITWEEVTDGPAA